MIGVDRAGGVVEGGTGAGGTVTDGGGGAVVSGAVSSASDASGFAAEPDGAS